MTAKVLHNQSILDIAIQHTGSVFNAFAIAIANDMAISETLTAGNSILIPDNVLNDESILNYYKAKDIQPATSLTDVQSVIEYKGIGWMKVGDQFKVD